MKQSPSRKRAEGHALHEEAVPPAALSDAARGRYNARGQLLFRAYRVKLAPWPANRAEGGHVRP